MYRFKVSNLSCGHCVKTVTKTLQSSDPSAEVRVDLASKQIWVESQAEENKLRGALRDAGYPVDSGV
jgi:copper chaperone